MLAPNLVAPLLKVVTAVVVLELAVVSVLKADPKTAGVDMVKLIEGGEFSIVGLDSNPRGEDTVMMEVAAVSLDTGTREAAATAIADNGRIVVYNGITDVTVLVPIVEI